MDFSKNEKYISPVLDLIEFNLEKGFAASPGESGHAGGNLDENEGWDW